MKTMEIIFRDKKIVVEYYYEDCYEGSGNVIEDIYDESNNSIMDLFTNNEHEEIIEQVEDGERNEYEYHKEKKLDDRLNAEKEAWKARGV